MADVKISGLPASTTPLAGTEVLPIVQGGQTRQVSVNNLTTGKAVSATQYTSTIVTGTAPLVVASTTEVANLRAANATSADTANQVKSNATTGVLQVAGPGTGTTRVMTTPDANFTTARTDAGQTFTGAQSITGDVTVGSNAIFFDAANQRIGINTVSPSREIHITKTAAPSIYMRNNTKTAGVDIEYNTVDFRFQVRDNSPTVFINNNVETARIAAGGDITAVGNFVVGTSGKGIDFSATAGTGTSELLADYEEGTFSPTVIGTTTAGTATYASQQGFYTKVGRLVTVNVYISWNTGTGTGNLRFSGLPFTVGTNVFGSVSFWTEIPLTALNYLMGRLQSGTTYIEPLNSPVGGGASTGVTYPASGAVMFTATYSV